MFLSAATIFTEHIVTLKKKGNWKKRGDAVEMGVKTSQFLERCRRELSDSLVFEVGACGGRGVCFIALFSSSYING